MRWSSRATCSRLALGATRLGAAVAVALAALGGVARAGGPADDPAAVAERDALIDKIARGQEVDASVQRFAALVKARDQIVAGARAAREADVEAHKAEHAWRESYKNTADSDAGWRCTLSVDPSHPVPSDEGRFKGDWGRVVKKERVTLAPKNALDDGEPAVLYEVAGQRRHYFLRGDKLGPGFPPRPIDAEVGDLLLVCDGDGGEHDHTEPPGWRGSPDDPSMRVPPYWRGRLQRHGFAARLAAPPKIAQKGRWNPIHITSARYFWAIHDATWKYPPDAYVLSDLTVGRALGGGRWDIPVDNGLSFVIEVPEALPRSETLVTGRNAWLILGHPRFDRALHKLVLQVEDVEPRYVLER
jgi:hypothetical protein